jgi:mannose/fructose/N-acetylgalactosamine-specific phosphotransferase system component IIC
MPMFPELILISLLGGLIALDKTEACQTMLSQPLLAGLCVGLLLHDLPSGIVMGVLFQLAYFWVMPIGTAAFPDSALGTVVGASGFVLLQGSFPDRFGLTVLVMLVFTIPFSLFAGWSLIKQRQLNSKLLARADLYAETVKIRGFGYLFSLALSLSFVRGFVVAGSGMVCILIFLKPLVGFLSFIPEVYLRNIEIPVWGFGIGAMVYLFGSKRNLLWCALGACLGIILVLI